MSFALDHMRKLAASGPVARVVVAATRGSVPREVGAAMVVTGDTVEGTIGGGTLEFEAIERARRALRDGDERFDLQPLGPSLGQCCGGAVSVLIEIWDATRLDAIAGDVVARPLPGGPGVMPLAVKRQIAGARSGGARVVPGIVGDWMIEPVSKAARDIWIWGAGHVGRALVHTLAPLPGIDIHWADCAADRFPEEIAEGVETLIAENPADLVSLAPAHGEHLVLTYSHALDLEICHLVLGRPFRSLGLIGSKTKAARFRSRLAALGHTPGEIGRMICPIGDPRLGKHPHAIAVGVAADLLKEAQKETAMPGKSA